MKTSLYTSIILLTLLIFISCRKNKDPLFDGMTCSGNCYILVGKLIDSAINTGISGGELKFYFNDISGTFSNRKYYLGRTITDANGNYSFKFDGTQFKNAFGYYYAEAYKGDMFSEPLYPNRVATFDLDTSFYNQPLIQNFLLFRPATLKVRVIATNVTNFSHLTVNYRYGKVGMGIVFNGGRSIDTTITWKTAGDLNSFITADALGNGVNIQMRDTIFIPKNNTRQIEIRL